MWEITSPPERITQLLRCEEMLDEAVKNLTIGINAPWAQDKATMIKDLAKIKQAQSR